MSQHRISSTEACRSLPMTRRRMLQLGSLGFGGLALQALLAGSSSRVRAAGGLAAQAAQRAIASADWRATGAALCSYERAWRRRFAFDFWIGRVLQHVHGNQRLLEAVVARAARNDKLSELLEIATVCLDRVRARAAFRRHHFEKSLGGWPSISVRQAMSIAP